MKIAIFSDVHGNLEAFKKVLADMKSQAVDASVCLGDCVGYGADPEAVLRLLWKSEIPSILGNHEEAVFNDELLGWFNPQAKDAILKTRAMLSEEAREAIRLWPKTLMVEGALCVHGFPPESVHTYLFEMSHAAIKEVWSVLDTNLVFVGHTHVLQMVSFDGESVAVSPLAKGVLRLDSKRYIINAGSVGQPRDGNNNAKYVIWNTRENTLEVRFVPYDIATAAVRILEAGMPEFCAKRLW